MLVLILMSCAGLQRSVQDFNTLTPKQKVTWMFGVYNSQAGDYKFKATFMDLTEEEKTILREKKKILEEVWPLIEAYDIVVVSGGVPEAMKEQKIRELLYRLERKIIRAIK